MKDKKNVTSIFLYSAAEDKVKRAVKYYHIDPKKAEKKIQKVNKERAKHYEYYTNQKWNDLSHYDLAINVDSLGVKKTAELIYEMIVNKK